MFRLLIAGDFYPGDRTARVFAAGDAAPLVGGLLPEFTGADLVVLNLEGPLIATPSPIQKIGPVHGTPEICARGLRQLNVGLVNLANNHVMDHGLPGLHHTLSVCRREGLAWVGGGPDLSAASQPWLCERNGVRLAVIGCAEHEFGMATPGRPGANPLDLVRLLRSLRQHRERFDRLVILLHAGNEYCPHPRPSLADLCRFLVEQGADAVVCQHSHCVGCWESYQGGVIVHGQGNFLFDDPLARPCEQEGMLVALNLYRDRSPEPQFLPFRQAAAQPGIVSLTQTEHDRFFHSLAQRNRQLLDPDFLEREWLSFCAGRRRSLLGILHGFGRRLRRWDERFGFLSPFFSRRHQLMMLHMLRCESHRESLTQVLTGETNAL